MARRPASATATTPTDEHRFVHRGHHMRYESYGTGDRVLVYMHGLLLDSGINRGLARALAEQGFRVVLLDLLGHGGSDKPDHASEYRMDLYAAQLMALLDDLGVPAAAVGGVSLGANVSLAAAVRAPDRMIGMVLEMPVLEWAVPAAALAFTPLLLGLHYGGRVVDGVSRLSRRLPRTPWDAANSVLNAVGLPPSSSAAVLHGLLVGPVAPTVEERGTVTVPTLVIGHRSDLIHPFSDASNLVKQMPNARLLESRSPVELRTRPHRITHEVAAFLDGLWAAAPDEHTSAA